jgi:hypothetical protein
VGLSPATEQYRAVEYGLGIVEFGPVGQGLVRELFSDVL